MYSLNRHITLKQTLWAFILLVVLTSSVLSQTLKVTVNSNPVRTEYISSFFDKNDYYISVNDLARILDVNVFRDEQIGKVVLYLTGGRVTLTSDNPFVIVGPKMFQMTGNALDYYGDLYAPAKQFSSILNSGLPGSFTFDEYDRELTISPGDELNITGYSIEEKENGSLIRIRTTQNFGNNLNDWFDATKNHLTIQFYKGRLDTLQMTNLESKGLVLRTTSFQFPEIAQITFKLSAYTSGYQVDQDKATGDVIISLFREGATIQQSAPIDFDLVPPDEPSETDEIVARDKEAWNFDTIIIDPGHGGKDPGTISGDLYEKDIVLEISKYLASLLEQSGLFAKVVLTRRTDVFIPLKERAEIAKDQGGKLFLSVHVNSNKNSRVRGFETYFLRPGKNDDALDILEVVQRENDVIRLYEKSDPSRELSEEEMMMLAMTQTAFSKESEQFAQNINNGISKKVKWPNRGVKQAGFLVLWRVPMPNILIEAGYMSNSSQRRDLRTRSVRHRIAEGIFEGIKNFITAARR